MVTDVTYNLTHKTGWWFFTLVLLFV